MSRSRPQPPFHRRSRPPLRGSRRVQIGPAKRPGGAGAPARPREPPPDPDGCRCCAEQLRAGLGGGWPDWLAGPLRGIGSELHGTGFETLMLIMCAGYLLVLCGARSLPIWLLAGTIVLAHVLLLLGTSPDLPGCLRIPGLRSDGRPARPGPLHPRRRRSIERSRLRLRGLAVQAFALRAHLHPGQLRRRAARGCRWAVGDEERRRTGQPRCRRAERRAPPRGWAARPARRQRSSD